jgi:hypothetical protein
MPAMMAAPPYQAPPAPPPAPEPPPTPAAPPPPPFFPLLAAALPNATEPSYAPTYNVAPMQSAMGPASMGQQVMGQAASAGRTPAPANALAAASVDASVDRRSLADMFNLLGARAAAPTGAFPSAFPGADPSVAASQSESQALFRRI